MIERFQGKAGRILLAKEMTSQMIVGGDAAIASQLLNSCTLTELNKNEVLISQDCDDNDLYFILSGSFNIEANGRLVAVRHAGTHVGEMAVIDCKAARCASVVAAQKSVVLKVAHSNFTRIADKYPVLWRRIAEELCGRLRNRNNLLEKPNDVPNVFICSSLENIEVAKQIQKGLKLHSSKVKVWTDQVFGPMNFTMEDLESEIVKADFAIAVMMGEDVVRSRKKQSVAPRDNVVFELGLFMGQIGRKRTIMVTTRSRKPKLPSDLLGLNLLYFSPPSNIKDKRALAACLSPVCKELKYRFDNEGPR